MNLDIAKYPLENKIMASLCPQPSTENHWVILKIKAKLENNNILHIVCVQWVRNFFQGFILTLSLYFYNSPMIRLVLLSH